MLLRYYLQSILLTTHPSFYVTKPICIPHVSYFRHHQDPITNMSNGQLTTNTCKMYKVFKHLKLVVTHKSHDIKTNDMFELFVVC